MASRSYRFDLHNIYSQNWHGLKSDLSIGEMVANFKQHNAFAVCGQETWRCGTELFQQDGVTFLAVGPEQQESRRGSLGVSISLSHRAAMAWQRAGREQHVDFGARLMAVRLEVRGGRRGKQYHRKMGIFLISGYAPHSGKAAAEHAAYEDAFTRLIAKRRPGDVLIACVDANSSVGRGSLGGDAGVSDRTGAVGPFGLAHINEAGRRLRSFMENNELASLASFFRKDHYATWIHPRSKLEHQLDHILISRADRCRFADAGSCPFQLVNSDHRAVGCRMRFEVSIQRKADPRGKMLRLDYSSLYEKSGQQTLADAFVRLINPSSSSEHTQIDPERPSLLDHRGNRLDYEGRVIMAGGAARGSIGGGSNDDRRARLSLAVSDSGYISLTISVGKPTFEYAMIAEALKAAATELLPKKPKPQPAWFDAKETELCALINARDAALNAHHLQPTAETATARTRARSQLQAGLRAATSSWIIDKCSKINDGIVAQRGTSTAWNLVSELRDGLNGAKRQPAPAKMRKPDGTLASTAEENAEVFAAAFGKLYGRTPSFDASMPELLRQRSFADGLDGPPTDVEIKRALGRLRDSGPGDSGLVARLWKALGATEASFAILHDFVLDFWETEVVPVEWETGLLKILPKKGDKSDPGTTAASCCWRWPTKSSLTSCTCASYLSSSRPITSTTRPSAASAPSAARATVHSPSSR